MGWLGGIVGAARGVGMAARGKTGAAASAAGNTAKSGIGQKGAGLIGKGFGALNTAMLVGQAVNVFTDDRAKGVNPLLAATHGVGEAILWQSFFAPMMAFEAAKAIPGIAHAVNQQRANQQREMMNMSPFRFKDSDYAQTTRQRALQAITESRGRARDYIGREAGLYAARYR